MAKIFMKTYGCTLNQSDADLVEGMLIKDGHELVQDEADAQTIIVNTCAVKETTENKILFYLKKLAQTDKKVIVAGCLPPANFNAIKKAIPNALGFIGPNSIAKIPKILEDGYFRQIDLTGDFAQKFPIQKIYKSSVARIQISSGCLSNCTFCATKISRGTFKSKPASLILNEARLAIKSRAKEIHLASQDNGCYGFDLRTNLPKVLTEMNEIEGRFRIRAGMANPQHLMKNIDEWIEAIKLPKVYKFLHLPLQSGSDRVLKEMQRGYKSDDAVEVCREIKKKVPGITLETDMIVGFPTETAIEFEMSLDVCRELAFDVVNFSKFSKRKGTKAAKMKQLHSSVIKERSEIMNKVVKQIALEQNQLCVGSTFDVLITEEAKNGYMQGRSDNYKPVLVKKIKPDGEKVEIGQFVRATIEKASITSLFAK